MARCKRTWNTISKVTQNPLSREIYTDYLRGATNFVYNMYLRFIPCNLHQGRMNFTNSYYSDTAIEEEHCIYQIDPEDNCRHQQPPLLYSPTLLHMDR